MPEQEALAGMCANTIKLHQPTLTRGAICLRLLGVDSSTLTCRRFNPRLLKVSQLFPGVGTRMKTRIALSSEGTPRIGCGTTEVETVCGAWKCMHVCVWCIINREHHYNPDVCFSWRQDLWVKSRLMLFGSVYVLRALLPCRHST